MQMIRSDTLLDACAVRRIDDTSVGLFFFFPAARFRVSRKLFSLPAAGYCVLHGLGGRFLAVGRRKIASSSSSSSCSVFFFVLFGGRDDAGVQVFACPTDSHLNGSHQVSIGASNSEISRILSRKKKNEQPATETADRHLRHLWPLNTGIIRTDRDNETKKNELSTLSSSRQCELFMMIRPCL